MTRSAPVRWLLFLLRFVVVGFVLLLATIAFEVTTAWNCDLQGAIPAPSARPEERRLSTAGLPDYQRPEEASFLSYPEWYIVWSYQEKADFQQEHLPSGFPYFEAIRLYWSSYCCVSRLARGKYPSPLGEHVALGVLGASFSAEYLLKGLYENTVGAFSEWTSSGQFVEEDRFASRAARDYAEFVHVRPFYEFHFLPYARGLWSQTPLWGSNPIRKWERKLFLTADYLIEAAYGWVIEQLTRLTYGYEPAETYAWISHADDKLFQREARLKKVKQVGPQSFIVGIPRYQEFTGVASGLAAMDVRFVEIAGNSQIALSVITPPDWRRDVPQAQRLFVAPIPTRPEAERVVLVCPVASLSDVIRALAEQDADLEHIYDY